MNCKNCSHNNLGLCDLNGKEIGIAYVLGRIQKVPRWCPKAKKK